MNEEVLEIGGEMSAENGERKGSERTSMKSESVSRMTAPPTQTISAISRDRLGARDFRRKMVNRVFLALLILASLLAIVPLLSVFAYVLQQGLPALNLSFFTHLPAPVGETGGGMGNAVLGTLILVALASVIGIPIGIAGGIYLSEYGNRPQGGKITASLRFTVDLLASVPSIIIGLFAYAVLVVPLKRFSAYAGGAALAVIIDPHHRSLDRRTLEVGPDTHP